MEQAALINTCNFKDVKPIMMEMPYPSIQVREQNRSYANLLSMDYCGSVSELSAITQYINNQNRLSYENCPIAKSILGIAIAEMIHLQKLGELIFLLGGTVDFYARPKGKRPVMWTPECLTLSESADRMLRDGIESEKGAINQYRLHIKMIEDDFINAVLLRIVRDEEYHIIVLETLIDQLG